jgi:plasmid stability protein
MALRTLTIKRIPEGLYHRLKNSATAHHRSLNSEVIEYLERSVGSRRLDSTTLLANIDALRKRVALPPLTERFLRQARAAGRP